MKDLTQIERGKTISFFNELDIETRTMLITTVSFFNELEIKNHAQRLLFHFFNEVATEMQKLSSKPLFHFLTRLPQRRKNYPQNLCFIF
jgi:hypothetical protein